VQQQVIGGVLADHEVVVAIVLPIAVNVMHHRRWWQRTPQRSFSNEDVLALLLSWAGALRDVA